jgi:dipeptidyl aminopeptidase/acylaminoacyl peptidase
MRSALALLLLSLGFLAHSKTPFTVEDDIGTALFSGGDFLVSPDKRFVAAVVERGNLATNRPEDEVRVYEVESARRVARGELAAEKALRWSKVVSMSPVAPLDDYRWLPDSSGLVLRVKNEQDNAQLMLAELRHPDLLPLTPADREVTAFDVRGPRDFIYALREPPPKATPQDGALYDFVLGVRKRSVDRSTLWVVNGERAARVTDSATGRPIVLFTPGFRSLRISPDGRTAIALLPVAEIPARWTTDFPKGEGAWRKTLKAGPQDLSGSRSFSSLDHGFFVIDLATAKARPLMDAPAPRNLGWVANQTPTWSPDGRSLLLTVFDLRKPDRPAPPCLALIAIDTGGMECLDAVTDFREGTAPSNFLLLNSAEFDGDRVIARYGGYGNMVVREFMRKDGAWTAHSVATQTVERGVNGLSFSIRQDFANPPVLVARDVASKKEATLWDPNPQLASVDLGAVEIFQWTDETGKAWEGGLFKPRGFQAAKRYPLVVQTHGFLKRYFAHGGRFSTTYAARELAAAGIVVLQAPDSCHGLDPPSEEAPCSVRGFDSAVRALDSAGLIDPAKVGILGFSRTVYHVEHALVFGKTRYAAASLADGVNGGYYQYLTATNLTPTNTTARDAEGMIGARPFGEGLKTWLARSPEFNLDKVTAPIIIHALGTRSVLGSWGTFASLKHLGKPVDMILYDLEEHVQTNPASRLQSQGTNVDWFRFWLQGYEDPNPAKKDHYERWRRLRPSNRG